MNFLLVLAVAFALAMDAFAVSVGISLRPEGLTKKQTFRMAFHFGFFQFMMPLLGWQATRSILLDYVEPFDHWVAFGLLLIIGVKMIFEFFRTSTETQSDQTDPTKGFSILMLSVATSIDALAVGMSLAALQDDSSRDKNRAAFWPLGWKRRGINRGIDPYSDWSQNSFGAFIGPGIFFSL